MRGFIIALALCGLSSAAFAQGTITTIHPSAPQQPTAISGPSGYLAKSNNLSDISNAATARTNLGLPPSATTDTTNASNITSGTLPVARNVFTQSGTGATARTVDAKLKDRAISVLDFGADPTGAVSSSTAFSAAVTKCVALAGCTIDVSSSVLGSTYVLSSQVTIAASRVVFLCDPGVTIVNGTTNAASLYFGDGTNQYYGSGMSGCTFAQKSGVVPLSGNRPFVFNKVGQFIAKDWTVTNAPAAPYDGPLFNNISQAYIDNFQVQNALHVGVYFQGALDVYGHNWRSDANGDIGIKILDSQGFYVSDATAYNNTTNGWSLGTLAGCTIGTTCNQNMFFTNVVGDTSGSDNWNITVCNVCTFTGAWGSTQQSTGVNTGASGFLISPSAAGRVSELTFNGGSALYNNGQGVNLFDSGSGLPNVVTFNGFNFGDSVHGNGRGGFGLGMVTSSAAMQVNVIGGQANGNLNGAFSFGAANTVTTVGVSGYNAGVGIPSGSSYQINGTTVISLSGSTPQIPGPALTGTPTSTTAAVDTNTTQVATTAYVVAQAASATPLIDGTAAAGTSTRYARADHVHPTDTTRAPLASPSFTGTVTMGAALKLAKTTAAAVLAITCDSSSEGQLYGVTDANSAVFNAALASGGANHMLAYCDATSWKIR